MKKTISFFCIASLIIIGCHPEPSAAQGIAGAGARKVFGAVKERVRQKAADFTADRITPSNKMIKNLASHEELVQSAMNIWKLNCSNSAKKQVISLINQSSISQEELIRLTAKAVIETIDVCIEKPQTLKSRIRGLTLDLVREILSEQHNFQLTSFNRQEKD
jgi:hypothetical protein